MTDRERWTVYPLLFLALGVSLKDKIADSVETKYLHCETMVCNQLAVIDAKGNPQVSAKGGGLQADNLICKELAVVDAKSTKTVKVASGALQASSLLCEELAVVDANSTTAVKVANGALQANSLLCGALVIPNAKGQPCAIVSSDAQGGFVRTLGTGTGISCFLGNADLGTERVAGLLFVEANGAIKKGPNITSPLPANPASEDRPAADNAEQPAPPSDEKKPAENKENEPESAQPESS